MSAKDLNISSQASLLVPVIAPGETYASVTETVTSPILTTYTRKGWFLAMAIAMSALGVFGIAVAWLLYAGIGIWGINIPVAWGIDIVNFVWWIGIGHAGTLISAILLLLRQQWRNSINRFAEAMTLFAVACAGTFPILHLGRPYLFYWLMPYPNSMQLWPQFRSPLMWDVFAVSTYATISLVYWYVGLIPDVATMRDKAQNPLAKMVYGLMAMGWRSSARHWHNYEIAYLLLGGLATPLVVSVHTVVSFDFAIGIVPGWHTTIFPPYFVAGAIYSGFAMVLTIMLPVRHFYNLKNVITMRHINNMAKVMLATGLIVGYGYLMEVFITFYSGNIYEKSFMLNRFYGPYASAYWSLILCNIAIPQLLWFKKFRNNLKVLWILTIVINIGMWLERFIIIVVSLHRDFLPSSWGMYYPTVWDWMTFIGTLGLFFTLMFLFIRVLPMINIFEVRHLVHEAKEGKTH